MAQLFPSENTALSYDQPLMTAEKKFWIITVANLLGVVLLGLVVYWIFLGFAIMAPEISSWPLMIVVAVGLTLSVFGLGLTRRITSRSERVAGYALHGFVFGINLVIVGSMAALYLGSTTEKFFIPEGYNGDVYVIYNAPDGVAAQTGRRQVTYVIPPDGILRVQQPMSSSFTRSEYFYQHPDGALERIRSYWPTTIHKTPENLSNDRDIGVYFPRTGTEGCSIQFQQFYVGTKAFLLTRYHEKNLSDYVREHPGLCNRQTDTPEKR